MNPIYIDAVIAVEYSDYIRTSTYRGKQMIGCNVKGLRWKQPTRSVFKNELKDDQKMLVKKGGCEWKVPGDQIIAWLGHFCTL